MLEQGLGVMLDRLVMRRRPMLCVTTGPAVGSAPFALPLLPVEYAAATSLRSLGISMPSVTCQRFSPRFYAARSGVIRRSVPYTTR